MRIPTFFNTDCKKESNETRYVSDSLPCVNVLTNKRGACCKQDDIQFMNNVVSIYDSRTNGEDNDNIEEISEYLVEFDHTSNVEDPSNIHIHMNSKKGKYLLDRIEEFQPALPIMIHSEKKFNTVPMSSPRVIYVVADIPRIQVPMHTFVTVTGTNSSASFRDIELFKHGDGSIEFERVLKAVEGKSFVNIDVPLVFRESMTDFFLLEDLTTSMFRIGNALVKGHYADTILRFEFMTESLHKRLIQVTLDSLGDFVPTADGVILDEGRISVEVLSLGGRKVACILKTKSKPVEMSQVEKTSELLDMTSVDFITFEDISVRDYLQKDPKNIVLFENNNKPHLTNIDDITVAMEEGIVYACKEANGHLSQDPSNVDSEIELFNARRIGTISGYIVNDHIRHAIRLASDDQSSRIFYLSESTRGVPAVISKRVYEGIDDLVSANHCQVGAEGSVFNVLTVKLN